MGPKHTLELIRYLNYPTWTYPLFFNKEIWPGHDERLGEHLNLSNFELIQHGPYLGSL